MLGWIIVRVDSLAFFTNKIHNKDKYLFIYFTFGNFEFGHFMLDFSRDMLEVVSLDQAPQTRGPQAA